MRKDIIYYKSKMKLTCTVSATYCANLLLSCPAPVGCSIVAGTPILNRFTAAGHSN